MATLIEKLEALKKPSSPNALEMMLHQEINNAIDDAIAVVRQHQSEQPRDVVERVARALWESTDAADTWDGVIQRKNNGDSWGNGMYALTMKYAQAAIAAMPATQPAGEVYRQVEEALGEMLDELIAARMNWLQREYDVAEFDHDETRFREALAALPALKPQPSEKPDERAVKQQLEVAIGLGLAKKVDIYDAVFRVMRPYLRLPERVVVARCPAPRKHHIGERVMYEGEPGIVTLHETEREKNNRPFAKCRCDCVFVEFPKKQVGLIRGWLFCCDLETDTTSIEGEKP